MLQCGYAYHLKFHSLHGPPKYKYCVLVSSDGRLSFLLINSAPTELERHNSDYIDAQVMIDSGRHGFLKHDSFIDCTDPIGMPERDAIDALENDNASRVLGRIEPDVLERVIEAIERSRMLKVHDKARFLEGLRNARLP